MKCSISFIMVLLFVLMTWSFSVSQPLTQPSVTVFVSYLFVLQWPPSICASTLRCAGTTPNAFTIHGLWPQDGNDNGVPPYNASNPCSNLTVVDEQYLMKYLLPPLQQQLTQAWPDLKNNLNTTLNQNFWEKEWKKHGKCSKYGDKPATYFSAAVSLRNNIVSALKVKSGTVQNIAESVYKQLNGRPVIHCVTDRASKNKLLGEIRLCYKKGDPTPHGIYNCTRLFSGTCTSAQDSITV